MKTGTDWTACERCERAACLAASPAAAQELTIFWAEWDPANYLQELVNLYTEETGVVVTVETTPWPDFQTKAFAEFNAKGDSLRHGGRRQPVARRRLDGRALRRPDRLLRRAQGRRDHGAGHGRRLRRVRRQVLGGPGRGRRHRLGLPQGLVRGPGRDGRVQGEVRLRSRHAEDLGRAARHRRVLPPPGRGPLRGRHLHRQLLRRAGHGLRERAVLLRRRPRRLFDLRGRRNRQLRQGGGGARDVPRALRRSPRRTGARPSSRRTTRRSPRAWRR